MLEVWRRACCAHGLLRTQCTRLSCLWGHSPRAAFTLAKFTSCACWVSGCCQTRLVAWREPSSVEGRSYHVDSVFSPHFTSPPACSPDTASSRACMLFPERSSVPPLTTSTNAGEGRAEGPHAGKGPCLTSALWRGEGRNPEHADLRQGGTRKHF